MKKRAFFKTLLLVLVGFWSTHGVALLGGEVKTYPLGSATAFYIATHSLFLLVASLSAFLTKEGES